MRRNVVGLLSVVLLGYGGMLQAETGYVVDQLLIGVRAGTDAEDKLLQVLPSGERVEILGRDGEFTRIRSTGGTVGWVESAYLTDQRPAASLVVELQDRIARLTEQLAQSQESWQVSDGALVSESDVGVDDWLTGLTIREWLLSAGVALIAALVGFALGYFRRSKNQEKRLSGMRI